MDETTVEIPRSLSSRASRALFILWPLFVILIFVAVGAHAYATVHGARVTAGDRHAARIDPVAQDMGVTPFELPPEQDGAPASKVHVGIYVDRIMELSTRSNQWTVDFYVWFRWTDPDLSPGQEFQVIDGEVTSRTLLKRSPPSNADPAADQQYYELYRVTATITKFFNLSRFPWDDHLLAIAVEDAKHPMQRLEYVADSAQSRVSSRVEIPGYDHEYRAEFVLVKPHSYKTARGDPSLASDHVATHSQLRLCIFIRRAGWGFYFKMFQGLFAAVAIALLTFFVKPNYTPRFSVGVGAFFAAVAAGYITARQLPNTEIVTLRDIVIGVGLLTIFLTLVHSAMALFLWERRKMEEYSHRMDNVMFCIFLVAYAVINTMLPIVAMA
jgi:hypothetical protein